MKNNFSVDLRMTYPRCDKCLWWEPYAEGKGTCYAHPVLPLFAPDEETDDDDVILWPSTSAVDRCPEFCEYIEDDYADPSEES